MSFRSIAWRLEELPWSWPLRLGAGVQMLRARWILEAIDHDGRRHQAELGPCPGVHPESLDEALEAWQNVLQPQLLQSEFPLHRWQWTEPYFGLLQIPPTFTSVQTAAEQLLLSWAQSQHVEEYALPAPLSIQGSALLALTSWPEFEQLWQEGFRVFKCKVGRQAPEREYDILRRMQDYAGAELQLRLDANQAMPSAAVDFWLKKSGDLPIQYWEETSLDLPMARDESLWDRDGNWPDAKAWILKPTRLGLSNSIRLLQKAAADQRLCVLSNAFDSGLTLRCSAWIYAAFCKDPQALGSGTARFLPQDMWNSQAWGAPLVTIPRHPFEGPT